MDLTFIPSPLRRAGSLLKSAWMRFAKTLGTINGYIIFTAVFIVAIGLYAVIARFISLFKEKRRTSTTFWLSKPAPSATLESLRNMF